MRRNSPNCTKNQSLGNFKKQTIIAHLISDTIIILKTGETVDNMNNRHKSVCKNR